MREAIRRVLEDVRSYYRGVLLAAVYVGAAGLLRVPACPMIFLTGLPCPGCGMTRAAMLFLEGRFLQAWEMHPFFYVLLVLGAEAAFFRYARARAAPGMRYLLPAALISAIVFYVYRMAKFFPGREPMAYFEGSVLGIVSHLVAHLRQIC